MLRALEVPRDARTNADSEVTAVASRELKNRRRRAKAPHADDQMAG